MTPSVFAPPVFYFPVRESYDTRPNLHLLGESFGNGAFDAKIFQLDETFPVYRASKMEARGQGLGRHCVFADYGGGVRRAVTDYVLRRLTEEYPETFRPSVNRLECRHTGETLVFGEDGELDAARSVMRAEPPYATSLDALACQVQEDMAVLTLEDESGANRVRAIHACSPNHWAPEEKIGGDFAGVHEPIPEMDSTDRIQRAIAQVMVRKGPYVRFAWGLATDRRLNHHPRPPVAADGAEWTGRRFEDGRGWFLRVERQTTNPLPEARASIFTIRTFFMPGEGILADAEKRARLARAVRSMPPASLAYKGMDAARERILAWLEAA